MPPSPGGPALRSLFVAVVVAVGGLGCDGAPRPAQVTARGAAPLADAVPHDASPHRSAFVAFGGARLHYLDWGGAGPVVVLLPGLGATAHSFDGFAPRLTDRFRVVALEPPAHGASGPGGAPLSVDRAARAVVALLDTLGARRAHLVGHSIAGAVITRVAASAPARVDRLVYLDATFDYGGSDEEAMERLAVARPRPAGGFASPAAGEAWARRYFYGTWTAALTADAVARSRIPPEEAPARAAAHAALLADAAAHPKEYARVAAPALAVWAEKTRASFFFWLDGADSAVAARADAYLAARRRWEGRGVGRFRRQTRHATVVAFPAHHAMYITAPERTAREVRRFLLARGRTRPRARVNEVLRPGGLRDAEVAGR